MASGVLYIPTARAEQDSFSKRLSDTAELRSPLRLFTIDVWLLLKNLKLLPHVVLPLRKKESPPGVQESKIAAFRDVFMNILLVGIELPLLFALPAIALTCPGWMFGSILAVSHLVIRTLAGIGWGSLVVESRPKEVNAYNEKWIFLNGIATSHNMLQQTCDTLAATFKRPVTGVHNRSYGIPGDLIECLVQRNFSYQSEDVRIATLAVSAALQDPKIEKVVVIAHSQGGLIMSLVLDRLYTGIPPHLFQKLEIYTFGSAAAYFHNPPLRGNPTLTPTLSRNDTGNSTMTTDDVTNASVTSVNSVASGNSASSRAGRITRINTMTSLEGSGQITTLSPEETTLSDVSEDGKDPLRMSNNYIPTIEHYCNMLDPVGRFGVLYHILLSTSTSYSGRVFVHQHASGHLFEQHYLQPMFPIDDDINDPHSFLNHEVFVDNHKQGLMRARTWDSRKSVKVDEAAKTASRGHTVRELSKLWRYLNGGRA